MAINDYGVNFGGRRIVHPGAADAIDATAMVATTPGSLNIPIAVGKASAGRSGIVQYFTSVDEAKQVLRGGDLVTALELMFSPTPEGGGGASRVGVIVANETTPASVTAGGIKHTSLEYGEGGNKAQVKLETGTITGTKKYTVTRWDLDKAEIYDNLGAVIRIAYTGASSDAEITVTKTDGKATSIKTSIGSGNAPGSVAEVVEITFGGTSTMNNPINIKLDGKDFNVSVTTGETGIVVADRIISSLGSWYFPGWTVTGTLGSGKVTFTATTVGPKVDATYNDWGTGITGAVVIKTQGAGGVGGQVDLNLDLTNGQFTTIGDIIDYLKGVSDYTATLVNESSAGLPASALDAVSGLHIKAQAGYLTSVQGELEYRINNTSELVNVEVTGAIVNAGPVYLTGGTVGTTPASWAPYFNTIKRQFSDMLVVLSDDEAIHAEALSHIGSMQQRNQKQILFTGGGVGETAAEAKQRAAGLNNSRAVLAYPGIYHRSHREGKVELPAYFTGALIAGRVAGVAPTEPITFDYFSVLGLGEDLLAGDPIIDDLITSGVACLERAENGGFRLVQGITTYLGGNNILYREISVRRGADDLSEAVRRSLETTFVGKKGVRATSTAVTTKVIEVLEEKMKADEIVGYSNIVVTAVNGVIRVDFQVAPVEPNNYILVTSHFVPDSV